MLRVFPVCYHECTQFRRCAEFVSIWTDSVVINKLLAATLIYSCPGVVPRNKIIKIANSLHERPLFHSYGTPIPFIVHQGRHQALEEKKNKP